MSGVRLKPDQRDRVIAVIEALCAGRVRMDGTLIAGGHALKPLDVLIEAAKSVDRFPALVSELIAKSTGKVVSVATYGEASRTMLMEWPRVQIVRDEAAEFEALAKAELRAEAEARARQAARMGKLAAPAAKWAA